MTLIPPPSNSPPSDLPDGPTWLSIAWMCADLGITRSTFDKWRGRGLGPRLKRLPNRDLKCRRDWYAPWLTDLAGDELHRDDNSAGAA